MPVAMITVVPAKTTSSRSWTPRPWRGRWGPVCGRVGQFPPNGGCIRFLHHP